MGKVKVTNISKFISFIIILVLIVVFIVVLVVSSNSKNINENTDISKLNSNKYSEKILEEYEKDGKKEQFLKEYDEIQNAVGVYLIENSTLNENSFENIVSDTKKILEKDNWEALNVNKPETWNGTWTLDDSGNVKFQFGKKEIEPSWSKDSEVSSKIIFN